MSINPDDLLIFKKRKESGLDKQKEEKEEPQDNKKADIKQQPVVSSTSSSPNLNQSKTQNNKPVTNAVVKNNKVPEKQKSFLFGKKSTPEKQKVTSSKSTSNISQTPKPKTQEEILSKQLFQNNNQALDNSINQQLSKESTLLNLGKTKEYTDLEKNLLTEKDLNEVDTSNPMSSNENKKEDINKTHSVTGLSCVNHPWRSAYALCNYCHRPFCYADLAKEDNKNYCLEDLDQITKTQVVLVKKNFVYNYVASIFLFLVVAILLIYAYQQIHYTTLNFYNGLTSLGLVLFIKTLTFNYIYQLQNPLIVLFSIIAGILLLIRSQKTTILSTLILVILSLVLSYAYLISNTYYFLYAFISCIIGMSIIALGKMNNMGQLHIAEATEGIEWPRIETF